MCVRGRWGSELEEAPQPCLFSSNPGLSVLRLQDKPTKFSRPRKRCFTPPQKARGGWEKHGLGNHSVGTYGNIYSKKRRAQIRISVSRPALFCWSLRKLSPVPHSQSQVSATAQLEFFTEGARTGPRWHVLYGQPPVGKRGNRRNDGCWVEFPSVPDRLELLCGPGELS